MTESLIWRSIAHRRKLFLVFIAVGLGLLPVLLAIFKPSYTGTAHVALVSESTQRDPLVKGPDIPVLAMSYDVLSRVKQVNSIDTTIGAIRRHLAVKSNSDVSNMITITFRDHDPKLAAAVANSVSEESVKYYERLSAQQYDRLIAYLTGELSSQRGTIDKLEHQVQQAAKADSFVSSDKAIDTITMRLDDLQGKLGDAMATLTADQAAAEAAAKQPADVAGIMRDQQLQSDPLFQNMRNAHARDAANLSAIKAQYTNRYPGLPSLQDQVQSEGQMLARQKEAALAGGLSSSPAYAQTMLDHRRALAVVAGDQARVAQYNSQLSEEQRRLGDLSKTGVSVAVLRTERDAAMTSYQALATQLTSAKTNQAEASSLGSLVVVDRAHDASGQFDNLVIRIAAGVFAVFAIAVLLAIIVEIVDPRLRTPNDIERLYGRPVIATVGS